MTYPSLALYPSATLYPSAPAVVAPPTPLPPILPRETRWSWAFGDWNGLPTGEMAHGTQRSLKVVLRGSSSVSFTLDGWAPEAALVRELVTDVWVIRNGQVLFRGRVGPSSDDTDGTKHTVSFTAGDYRGVLARRALYDADPLAYTAADRSAIAWGLLSTTQGQPGGNLGIVRGVGQSLGTSQTITYPAGQFVGPAIDQLQAMDAGFDWDVTPALGTTTQTFDVWPYRGINGSRVLSYPGSIASFRRQVDPGNYANAIRETGNTDIAAARVEAAGIALAAEGRWDAQLGDTTLLDAASVTARATYDLSMRSQVVPTWTVTLRPGEWGGPTDVWIGDTITLDVHTGRLSVNGEQYRVLEVDIALDESDNETVTLTLGQLIAGSRFGDRSILYRLTQLERR